MYLTLAYVSCSAPDTSFTPSANDVSVLANVSFGAAAGFAHVTRWVNHISSFSPAERAAFPGGKAAAAAPAAAAADDDDGKD
jgi:hypothetical protein